MGCLFELLIELLGVFSIGSEKIDSGKPKSWFSKILKAILLFVLCVGLIAMLILVVAKEDDVYMKVLFTVIISLFIVVLIVLIIQLFLK